MAGKGNKTLVIFSSLNLLYAAAFEKDASFASLINFLF